MVDLGIASQRQVFVQEFGDRIASTAVCAAKLGNTIGALGQLVLDVMADQCAKFQIAFSSNFRKVVFPNKQILVILPRRLMPKGRISIRRPERRQSYARRFRKDSWKLGSDIAVE